MHCNKKECDRRSVVKNFCFGEGCQTLPIKTIEHLEKILYSEKQSEFAFTLNSHDDQDQVARFELQIGLNFLCIKFADIFVVGGKVLDIQHLLKNGMLFEIETVYCFMFKSSNFQLYSEMLLCLFHARQYERNEFQSAELRKNR